MRHPDGGDDFCGLGIGAELGNETLVDFQQVKGEALQIAQRYRLALELREGGAHCPRQRRQRALGA